MKNYVGWIIEKIWIVQRTLRTKENDDVANLKNVSNFFHLSNPSIYLLKNRRASSIMTFKPKFTPIFLNRFFCLVLFGDIRFQVSFGFEEKIQSIVRQTMFEQNYFSFSIGKFVFRRSKSEQFFSFERFVRNSTIDVEWSRSFSMRCNESGRNNSSIDSN